MINKQQIEDLLIEFDEMGFIPLTTVPNPEDYARDYKRRLISAVEQALEERETRLTFSDRLKLVKITEQRIARKIIEMFSDKNYITDQDIINAIAKRYEVEVEE